ncbi:heavy metal-binding domain-containing protein [Brooklawnia sp.]|uniref:heavy metal-binding domain-containing protein n=1 Tax=Brooklawnia sp. TaxID=2699740 RepID=UPI00311D8316
MLVITMSQIPGYRIEAVLGEVFGVGNQPQVRPDMGPAEMVYLSREQAVRMMVQQAGQRAANAVIGYSIDISQSDRLGACVTAIGTAVSAVPIEEGEDGATPQSIEDAKIPGGQIPQSTAGSGQSAGAQPSQPPQSYPAQPGHPAAPAGPGYAQPGQQRPQQNWGQQQYPQGYGR